MAERLRQRPYKPSRPVTGFVGSNPTASSRFFVRVAGSGASAEFVNRRSGTVKCHFRSQTQEITHESGYPRSTCCRGQNYHGCPRHSQNSSPIRRPIAMA